MLITAKKLATLTSLSTTTIKKKLKAADVKPTQKRVNTDAGAMSYAVNFYDEAQAMAVFSCVI